MDFSKMKTLADFKRAMIKGSRWTATHQFIGDNPSEVKDLGERECVLHNTVDFGFYIPDKGRVSHSAWPKAKELQFDGEKAVITKPGFVQLTYTLVKGGDHGQR